MNETALRSESGTQVGERLGRSVPHVQLEGLERASDDQVWEYARLNGFAIVTKDADFNNLSVVRGSPPKVIWLLLGNCTTAQVEAAFRARFADIEAFDKDPLAGTLAVN